MRHLRGALIVGLVQGIFLKVGIGIELGGSQIATEGSNMRREISRALEVTSLEGIVSCMFIST